MRLAAAALILSFGFATAPAYAQLSLQRPDDGISSAEPAPDPMDGPLVLRPQSAKPPVKPKAPSSAAPVKSSAPAAGKTSSTSPKSSAVAVAKPAGVAPKSSAPAASGLAAIKPAAGPAKSSAPKAPVLATAKPAGAAAKPTTTLATAKPAGAAAKPATTLAAAKPPTSAPAVAVSYRQCADSYFAGASLLRADPTAVDTLLQRAQLAGERQLKVDPSAEQGRLVQAIKMSGTARAAEIRALDEEAGPKAAQALFKTIRQCDAKMTLPITGPLTMAARGPAPETAPVARENAP